MHMNGDSSQCESHRKLVGGKHETEIGNMRKKHICEDGKYPM